MFGKSKSSLFQKLGKTRDNLRSGLANLFGSGTKPTDADFELLEEQLITADLGVTASMEICESLRKSVRSNRIKSADELHAALAEDLVRRLAGAQRSVDAFTGTTPRVILMVGVNGVGKTTTTAKLAHRFQNQGKKVMLAACDTFRAAAIEQLQRWGDRLDVPVIAQKNGSDAAAVAHDALQSAVARDMDVLIIDSAGRQHINVDLMEQLGKVVRVLKKIDDHTPHEVWLTIDAGNGQNVLSQIENFSRFVSLSGVCVTKLDGTAKGGILVAIAEQFQLPVMFIGVGEKQEDLREFVAQDFVDALLDRDD